jgi:hypothetical protein
MPNHSRLVACPGGTRGEPPLSLIPFRMPPLGQVSMISHLLGCRLLDSTGDRLNGLPLCSLFAECLHNLQHLISPSTHHIRIIWQAFRLQTTCKACNPSLHPHGGARPLVTLTFRRCAAGAARGAGGGGLQQAVAPHITRSPFAISGMRWFGKSYYWHLPSICTPPPHVYGRATTGSAPTTVRWPHLFQLLAAVAGHRWP